jgi:hypothetical protein
MQKAHVVQSNRVPQGCTIPSFSSPTTSVQDIALVRPTISLRGAHSSNQNGLAAVSVAT